MKYEKKTEFLVRVIAPSLADIAKFHKRLEKIAEVYPTGTRRSEIEHTWRGYFVVVLKEEEAENE
jgi:hypothetical protein